MFEILSIDKAMARYMERQRIFYVRESRNNMDINFHSQIISGEISAALYIEFRFIVRRISRDNKLVFHLLLL